MHLHELRQELNRYADPTEPLPDPLRWAELMGVWAALKPTTPSEYCPIIEDRIALLECRMLLKQSRSHADQASDFLAIAHHGASLEQFRTERVRKALGNPREFVSQVDGFLDQLEQGMEQAEAHQEQDLYQLRMTKRLAQKRVDQFRRRADEYRLKTDILGSIENAELDELADISDEVNALGKPADADESPSA